MRRVLEVVVTVVIAAVAGTSGAAAQSVRYGIGGGLIAPSGDYSNLDQAGWHALGKVDLRIPMSPVGVRVDGMYGRTSHQNGVEGNTKLAGGTADLVVNIPLAVPMVKPYLLAGVGVANVKTSIPSLSVDTSATKVAFGGGAGVSIGVGPVHGFVEARYLTVPSSYLSGNATGFLPITAGLTFGSK